MNAELPLARRDAIAARLKDQAVVAAALAAEFGVSEDAIRRDLRALAADGRCRRVYGGALPLSPATEPMTSRIREGSERKDRLARAAITVVQPGETLFLDSGSTNLALVEFLHEDADLTVVTNAVEIAGAVLRRQDLRLILVGGLADPVIGGCVDAAAVQIISRMRFDRVFLGACSVSAEFGIGAFHFADATFKRAVLETARHSTVLATSDKLMARTPYQVAGLDRVDLLVLEAATTAEQRRQLEGAGCRLLVASDD
jgi:DeoR/GlpR family transcriptional regulator of sugar metabolism